MSRAVYGGSFDPFHNGHLALVRAVLAGKFCDELLIVPAAISPHKFAAAACAADRLAMVELGLAGIENVRIIDFEIGRDGPSFTVDTLEELVASDPAHEPLVLVMGDDSLSGFPDWRNSERILELAELIVFARKGAPRPSLALTGLYRRIPDFDMPVSSTEVRSELAAGRLPRDMLPEAVLDYIVANGLYGAGVDGNGGDGE